MRWLLRLQPQQKMQESGSGNVQAAKVDGDLHNNHSTRSSVAQIAQGVHVGHVDGGVHVYQFHSQQQITTISNAEQRAVLAMIRRLRNGEAVFAFMARTFGTRMVIDLQPSQLLRVRRYVETINQRSAEQRERA